MNPSLRLYIAGHGGMVGSAIARQLTASGHAPQAIITRTHAELDLCNAGGARCCV